MVFIKERPLFALILPCTLQQSCHFVKNGWKGSNPFQRYYPEYDQTIKKTAGFYRRFLKIRLKLKRGFRLGAISQSSDVLAQSDGDEQGAEKGKSHQIASSVQEGNQNDQCPGKKQIGHAHSF